MTADAFPFGDSAKFDADAVAAVLALGDGVRQTIGVARALIDSGRTVNLAGLDRAVGLLCAKALDLTPDSGRTVTLQLRTLRQDADALVQALHAASPR